MSLSPFITFVRSFVSCFDKFLDNCCSHQSGGVACDSSQEGSEYTKDDVKTTPRLEIFDAWA